MKGRVELSIWFKSLSSWDPSNLNELKTIMASHRKHQKLREETVSLFKLGSSIAICEYRSWIDDDEDDQATGEKFFWANEFLEKTDYFRTQATIPADTMTDVLVGCLLIDPTHRLIVTDVGTEPDPRRGGPQRIGQFKKSKLDWIRREVDNVGPKGEDPVPNSRRLVDLLRH